MNQLTNLKSLILIPLALACLSLAPKVIAKGNPVGCNTSDGFQALFNLTTGTGDTAVGGDALFSNTDGSENTAVGCSALSSNISGFDNTATGFQALEFNQGFSNTAVGAFALFSNIFGSNNTAVGGSALVSNTTGELNTAVGAGALLNNIGGSRNTATGELALANTTGSDNIGMGVEAGRDLTTGNNNIAVGTKVGEKLSTGNGNIAIGTQAGFNLTTGNNNIAVGINAGNQLTTGDRNIDIGNHGVAGDGFTIRIGTQGTQAATFIAGIFGTPVDGSPVVINLAGQLGVSASSARFKEEIKPMDKTSEVILALKPVTFRYKKELDPKGIPQFGLVAEEVEKVNPDLITRDRDGKPYTVRYEVVNAMLLNEFLKAHRRLEEQQKEIATLRQLIQKVSDKVEMNAAPQMAASDQ
jgi:hypothetical protein